MTTTANPADISPDKKREGDSASRGQIETDSVGQSGRLASLVGVVLLILVSLMASPDVLDVNLGHPWLAWAWTTAAFATLSGPVLQFRLQRGANPAAWRIYLLVLMSAITAVWVFASVVVLSESPVSVGFLVIAWLALSIALMPSVGWLPGLVVHLLLHFILLVVFSISLIGTVSASLLPIGLWISLVFLAATAGLYARRVVRVKGDLRYLRIENTELQNRLVRSIHDLESSSSARRTLEAELAEILSLAEDANRAKTEFLATMSHEIRTPLNGILPILEMLQETGLDHEQQRLVRTAQGSSRHLLRIINDILDFAKVESGKLQLEAIEIDVRELVDSVSELMRGSARNQNLKLTVRIAENVPQMVRGDPIRLRQVLINLVSNAIKFTEEGGIRIEVSRGQSSQKEIELLFAVADTGMGMTQETTDRLFQLFTQADASTTRKHGGTGLGLVICKRLVELMGGKIGVRSALNQGSTFWFLVPLRKSVVEVPSSRRDLKGVRVLSLIDDPALEEAIGRHLAAWGISEETSDDPQESVAVLRSTAMLGESWRFQLVLIDGNAFETQLTNLLGEIRAIETLRNVHIVVSLRSEKLAQRLKRDYGVYVLGDDLRPEPLRRLLNRIFDVESRTFGTQALKPEEIYDDLNLTVADIIPNVDGVAQTASSDAARVLLVEDNPVNQGVVSKALALLGVYANNVENGEQAVERCRSERFDLVLMDCQMPVMDGYEATRLIREAEQLNGRPPVPIVAMTANAMTGDREKCLAAGMDDYIAKPVSISQLKECLGSWLPSTPESTTLPPDVAAEQPAATAESIASDEPPVLDVKVLDELREIMQEDYLRLLKTYLDNAPELLDQGRGAIQSGNAEALVIPVHSLKSSSANVGAMAVSVLAKEGERLARENNLDAASRVFEQLEEAFGRAQRALREHISENQAA